MPYIKMEDKVRLQKHIQTANNAGELNFLFTDEIAEYIANKGLSYQTINDILGALEGAKAEFYRRVAVPCENTKLSENGDVY